MGARFPRRIASLLSRAVLPVAVVAVALLAPRAAMAQATVHVQVRGARGPVDGRVELLDARGAVRYGCTSRGGRCRMEGVQGGRYRVRFRAPGRPPTRPRPVIIPPEGHVTLVVSAE